LTSVDEDKCALESIANDNQIRAALFIPFTVARLRGIDEAVREARLTISLRNVGCASEEKRYLRLTWRKKSARKGILPVQERAHLNLLPAGLRARWFPYMPKKGFCGWRW